MNESSAKQNETQDTAIAKINVECKDAFLSTGAFEAIQRIAKVFAASDFVPKAYRGKIGECVIALEMASRMKVNPLAVMQNLKPINGNASWSSQFKISCVNSCGRFSPLRYEMTGKRGTDSWGCVAWAHDLGTREVLRSPEVTIGIAKAEKWFDRDGSKWRTMPELMLHYRAASSFANLYAPELAMGILTQDEVMDISPVAVVSPSPAAPRDATGGGEEPALAAPLTDGATPPDGKSKALRDVI